MSQSREQICHQVARKLAAAAPNLSDLRATIGLDGFVDEIIAVVDKRQDNERYDAIPTIEVFGRKISEAAGKSMNFELVVKQMKLGGNGPIMANAMAAAGVSVTYIGAVGFPNVHPVFQEMATRAEVIGLGDPGHTDALEFADGKLMLGKYTREMGQMNWDTIRKRLSEERFAALMDSSTFIGMVNWTMLPYLTEVWENMVRLRLPNRDNRKRALCVDLCDPEKRTFADTRHAMSVLTQLQDQVDVILGLNLKEAVAICEVLGLPSGADETAIERTARNIREATGVSCVVVHPRSGAAGATPTDSATFAGPFVKTPKISTGAGDHFNAGFCLGWILGLTLPECLCTGVGTSGYYVRTAISPSAVQLAEFIENLPPPQ